jgi:hypothetical protein
MPHPSRTLNRSGMRYAKRAAGRRWPLGRRLVRARRRVRRRGTSRLYDEGRPVRDGFPQRPGDGREELVGVVGLLEEGHGAEGHGVGAQARLAVKTMTGMPAVVPPCCRRSATSSPVPPGSGMSNSARAGRGVSARIPAKTAAAAASTRDPAALSRTGKTSTMRGSASTTRIVFFMVRPPGLRLWAVGRPLCR